ncbi:amino acid adenylation domain-containing protein [Cylindrospermum sp. NIES-4074]|nr:amino acid adenylation domain-containing protein [Cylindrospermum sp. NIES-4074]
MSKGNVQDFYPLSPMQQGMLFHTLYSPESGVYCEQLSCTLQGELNISAFQRAWQQILDRHPCLRTAFVWEGIKEPVQVVQRQVSLPWQQLDWRDLAVTAQQQQLEEFSQAEREKGFELRKAPLMRLALIQLTNDTYEFIWTHHHLLLDGWSTAIVLGEVLAIYAAYCGGEDLSLPRPRPYRDYIVWLQQQQERSPSESFWRQQLQGFTAPTQLRVNKSPNSAATLTDSYQIHQINLSATTTAALQSLAKQYQVTLNTLVQGAWALLLSRYSGETDVVFGTTVSGRPPELTAAESMVGLFINTLPVRVKISEQDVLVNWLQQLQVQQVELRQYEYSQLAEIQQWSEVPPGTSLFETLLVFENYPTDPALRQRQKSLKISNVRSVERTNYPLTLIAFLDSELSFKIAFDSTRFERDSITRLLGHLKTLLEGFVANPQQHLQELPLLTTAEKNQLLVEWTNANQNYPQDRCIHQLFAEQVEKTPEAIAVVFEDQKLTYRELNQRANQLAHYLQKLGVKPETLVGLCVERSHYAIIGILAILKAGGAYLPIDPTNPSDRTTFMLADAQVPVLLTQEKLLDNLPEHNAKLVVLETSDNKISEYSQSNPVSDVNYRNLAYVIYTSGSTGKPKGVLVNHANVARLFTATQTWYNFNNKDVWTLFHSIAFDFSVWEIWGALIHGGKLVIVPYLISRSPQEFYQLLCQERVTVLNQTPSAFRQLIQAEATLGTNPNLNLRLVIFGGEALELQSLQPWFDRHGDQKPQLVNMYGITETTVHVTYRPLSIADLKNTGSVIGCPIPDLQVYLLDLNRQLVPIGVPGEIYVGGAGVARGYLNRPELTKERFIADPFNINTEAKLYKSGDLARYLPNGGLEYLGRIDHQVKIRGFRIELGEIEAQINQHPAVRESVVLVREDTPGEKLLVAYIVSQPEQTLKTEELRSFLQEKLPQYMVPAAFVLLESLPLTINGKVDTRLLPAPARTRPDLAAAFVAPRNEAEKVLADIWKQVLGVDQIGVHDNFFALGGDSIRSIQVQSLAQKQSLSFSLPQLFQHQTITQLIQSLKTGDYQTTEIQKVQEFSLISSEDKQQLPADIEDAYPLAQLQMGMIFHSEYNQENATYLDIFSFHLQAPLNVEVLQVAIQKLVSNHPILRTSIRLAGFSQPLQLVHRQVNVPLQVQDLRHLSPVEQEEALNLWFAAEQKQHFNWAHPPLLRFQIHRRTDETFQITLTFHHAILDGWSVGALLTELFGEYLFLLGKTSNKIQPAPISAFRDFVALEREAIACPKHQQYWQEKLVDSTITMLPRWSSHQQKLKLQQICCYEVPISAPISQGLQELAKSVGVTLKSVLLAAHLRVLSLLSGQSDVITGLVSNGRPEQTDGERVLGLFLNTIPLRLNLSKGSWIDLIRNVFEAEKEVLPFRRYPLAEIQRVHGNQPLFEVAFNYINFHVYQGLQGIKDLQVLEGKFLVETNFPLVTDFSLDPFSREVKLTLNYDAMELCQEQVELIGGYYARTLAAMVAEPQEDYQVRSLLSEQEQYQLLVEWNNTHIERQQISCIHHLFENQVKQTPDAVAAVFGEQKLTYRQLNEKANQLAHHLQNLQVKSETLVGICVERSLEMLVGILGILKAGGAYVPLDPAYPRERLSYMLSDSQAPVLLTQKCLLEILPEHNAKVICLDTDWDTIQSNCENSIFNLPPIANLLHLAYVIYTSGSTGKPKGTLITHQGLVNYLSWCIQAYAVEQGNGSLVHSSIAFDATITGLFAPLLVGRQVHLLPENLGIEALSIALQNGSNYSLVKITPAHLELLSQQLPPQQAAGRTKAFIIGGENLTSETIAFWEKYAPETLLVNEYGPTETVVGCCIYKVPNGKHQSGSIPIGRPIANTQLYLLNEHLQPVPIGVPGELYIGGAGVARGYLNLSELTAEKFIPHPFSTKPGEKLYKTGDLARYLPNGDLEYLGRIDHQVKIRGFRIELGEIEAVLSQHPGVQQSFVLVQEDKQGNKLLVSYVVPAQELTLTPVSLRRFLKEKLPNYMIPAAFVLLEKLPLTPNGKVDRDALPASEITSTEDVFVAPRTPQEEIVAQIWAQVLGIKQVGIYDNFFDLGGHSLIATQVISRIREAFGVEIPVAWLFEFQTVATLTECIGTQAMQKLAVQPIQQVSRNHNLPLSFAQQRMWLLHQLTSEVSVYNSPTVVRLNGALDTEVLEQSLNAIVQRHEVLRTSFVEVDGEPVQVITYKLKLSVPIIDLSELASVEMETQVHRLIRESTLQPFDLTHCPLLRFTLLKLSPHEHIAILTIHHIVSDAWSMGVFLEELAALYAALSTGKPSPLLELKIQYPDFAVWQRQWLQGDVLRTQLDYWKQQLGHNFTPLKFSNSRSSSNVTSYQGAKLSFVLPKDLTEAIAQLSRQSGVTLFMTLLAAYQTLLYCYTGQEDIRIGSPIANRSQVELEKLIGFFINTLVLRGDLSGNPSFKELLVRSRQVALGAYAHQDLPFDKLVEELQPERKLGHTSLYHAWFVLQNAPMPPLELPGLTMSLVDIDSSTVRHDLLLNIWENPEGLNCTFEYKTDLFDKATISRLSKAFERLLQQVVANPNIKLNELSTLVSETDKQQQLMQEAEIQAVGIQKLKTIKRKAISN